MTVAVIDYGIGNLHSAQKALRLLGADAVLTDEHDVIKNASAVVLPGVGNFGACMTALRDRGLDDVVHDVVRSGRPFLGICVGMQMLFESSEEAPGIAGLGLVKGSVRYLPSNVRRPQMQWNELVVTQDDPVLTRGGESQWMYFVHSLAAQPTQPEDIAATVSYGGDVTAACRSDNVLAVQFHPEKSGRTGLAMLERWLTIEGVV
ncbi:MAG: imidazole glycerol phosphate synthase subunit HisH [Ilumatobacteraceae bacterium]